MFMLIRLAISALLINLAIVASGANTVDDALERADAMIETDPHGAVRLCDSIGALRLDAQQEGQLLHTKGNALFAEGKTDEAKPIFRLAAKKSCLAGDSLTWASALSDLGICYRITEQLDSALASYEEALEILQRLDAPTETAYLLTSIAVFYANQGRFDEAAKYGRRAFALAKQSDNIESVMYAGGTLGIVLYLGDQKDEGLSIEREMVDIARQHGMPRYILKTYAAIIDMHYKDGRRDSVDFYLERGREILPQVPEASVEALGFLEESYVVLSALGRYDESLEIQQKILSLRGAGTFMPFSKLYQRMARNYQALGEIDLMANAYERAISIADSIHGLEIDRQLSEFDVKYDTAERELKIVELEKEKAHRDMIIIAVSASALLLTGFLTAFFLLRRRRQQMAALRGRIEAVDLERSRFAAELHDGICSDLTGIALMLQARPDNMDDVVDMIGSVRNDVRSISHNLMPPRMNGMNLSMLLEDLALRDDSKITLEATSCDSPVGEVAFQSYRIAQEWIDNILKHSQADSIVIRLTGTMLEIKDNGAPFDANNGKGIGMETTRNRARAIGAVLSFGRIDNNNFLKLSFDN